MKDLRPGAKALAWLAAVWLAWAGLAAGQSAKTTDARFLSLNELRPGMKGTAYTVFKGTEPEPFGVEVLGVLRGIPEARQALIIARLSGANAERTGVFAGMSGSPVYVNDKLVGAIAYSFPFSKEPIAGITPIEQMVENFAGPGDTRRAPPVAGPVSFTQLVASEWQAGWPETNAGGAITLNAPASSPLAPLAGQVLQPIATPLFCNGVRPDVLAQLAPQLATYNLHLVAGAGGHAPLTPLARYDDKTLAGGRSVSVQLARGDYTFDAAGTVTFRDGEKIYAFGHPFLRIGAADMPMMENEVVTVVTSVSNSFKLSAPGRLVGVISQDRSSGIFGQLGRAPRMIPVRLNLHNTRGGVETFNFEVADDPALTPILLQITIFSSLSASERTFGAGGYTMSGQIQVAGQPAVRVERRLANNSPALAVANTMAATASALMATGLEGVRVEGVTLDATAVQERNVAVLERIALDKNEAGRGQTVEIKAFARNLAGAQFVHSVALRIPADVPPGDLTLTVGDGFMTQQRSAAQSFAPRDLGQLVNALNGLRRADQLYVRLTRAAPGAVVASSELPNLPPSMLATLGNERNAGGYTQTSVSPVFEQEIAPAAFIITGQQSVTLKIVR